ncbi:putative portal protein [Rhizobium phage RHph_I65]|nr:putative portal protein [Rhizobium phage RHph_I65]
MTDQQNDSLRSLLTGLGDPNRDKAALGSLGYMDYVLDDQQLWSAYRNSWIARKIVNIPAQDACRRWRAWQADQEQITLIEKEEKRLGLKGKLLLCKTLARLWGGAAIYIGDGGRADQPLNPELMGKGGLKYLTVMSRREVIAGQLQDDPTDQYYNLPRDYQVANSSAFVDIHPSRLVIQIGEMNPDPRLMSVNQGWGDSSLQAVYSALTQADSATANISSLLFEANIDVFGIPGLMELVSTAKDRQKILDRMTLAAAGKSINRALIMDAEEEYNRHTINFSNLPELMQAFLTNVSGAADIPLTRFLGQSPAGLNSTGEGDMKNYQDRVTAIQELEIQPQLSILDDCLVRSALGARPEEIFYNWNPLEQMSEKELAEIGKLHADTAQVVVNTGLFMPEELRQVVGNQFVESGLYPGLGDLLKENGEDLPEFDLERRSAEATVKQLENPPKPKAVGDAAPRSLYVKRDVLNGEQIARWYREQNVPGVYAPNEMHVTIVYSKKPVDWMKLGSSWAGTLELPEGGPRMMELFGAPGEGILVLLFQSAELDYRAGEARDIGAEFTHGEYQSHITISLLGNEVDLANVKPYQGPITLGPEIFQEIDDSADWKDKVQTE